MWQRQRHGHRYNGTSQRGRQQREWAQRVPSLKWLPALALALIFLLASCGSTTTPSVLLSADWHDIITPSNQPLASYAISPNVPGLMLACIGAPAGNLSASPMGPATIWRTRDGGKSWQRLSSNQFLAGCQLTAVANGNGLFFAYDRLGNGAPLATSRDAGDHWTPLDFAPTPSAGDIFALLAASIYRDGRLYAPELPDSNGSTRPLMSVSNDDGQHWTALEAAPDPLIAQGYQPLSLAADYRAPDTWYRLLGKSLHPAKSQTVAQAVLEHSNDGGHTWQVMQRIGPAGSYDGTGSAALATTAAQPGRLCAAFYATLPYNNTQAATNSTVQRGVAALRERINWPPPTSPHVGVFAASSDGGQSWASTTITKQGRNDDYISPSDMQIDPQGNCYLSDNRAVFGAPEQDTATIWRFVPGATAPQPFAHFAGAIIGTLGVAPGTTSAQARLIATLEFGAGRIIYCQGDGPCPASPSPAPRLIWTAIA